MKGLLRQIPQLSGVPTLSGHGRDVAMLCWGFVAPSHTEGLSDCAAGGCSPGRAGPAHPAGWAPPGKQSLVVIQGPKKKTPKLGRDLYSKLS